MSNAKPTAVILIVGLTPSLLTDATPRLKAFADQGTVRQLRPVLPAVTCSVQSSMLTGLPPGSPVPGISPGTSPGKSHTGLPSESLMATGKASGGGASGGGHGIVGNGWYDREYAEVRFWKQSNHLVAGEKVWETARRRDPSVTCANMFWWFNMYSSVDYSVTPRPIYKADGRKIPDVYSHPADLRDELQDRFGRFPLFNFWGPASSIKSSQWIADASLYVHQKHRPTLTLIYLPHLDYALQKLGPDHAEILDHAGEIDRVFGQLLDYFDAQGVDVVVVSEYGIEPVDDAVMINRHLREEGALRVRQEQGLELLDPGASDAFAVADHQVAHVYVANPHEIPRYKGLCEAVPGIDRVLDRTAQAEEGLDHPRSGDLVLVASPRRWFSYAYWPDDRRAPDFARTVDIHRKPGYDPLELFIDPAIRLPRAYIARKLLQKKLGFRTLLDVIPLDPSLVRGSHGRVDQPASVAPLVMTRRDVLGMDGPVPCVAVREVILRHLFPEQAEMTDN